jgi:hypothetical protein
MGPPDGDVLDELVRRGDIDELLRLVDAQCTHRDWVGLDTLRERCARAHETGHQLWPAAAHAAYRLALEAPGEFAAEVLVEDAARFALGPLPEVAAQQHTWSDLAPHVHRGAPAVLTAHERVMRGEDLSEVELPGPPVLEVPLRLMSWEPRYALAEYRAHDADFPMPPLPALVPVDVPARGASIGHDEVTNSLRDLVHAWAARSEGHVAVVATDGNALDAIAALIRPVEAVNGTTTVHASAARLARLEPAEAQALMAWAGASGGAHGRRPGAAPGRFAAWWAAATLTGLADDWPPASDRLGEALPALRWFAWDEAEATTGWRFHLAVEDPARGRAWAIAATDTREVTTPMNAA